MRKQQHSVEPWKRGTFNPQCVVDSTDKLIVADYYEDRDQAEANARRIVACVNACKGISTETLEQVRGNASASVAQLDAMRQQRDKLLVMVKQLCPRALKNDYEAANKLIAEIEAPK